MKPVIESVQVAEDRPLIVNTDKLCDTMTLVKARRVGDIKLSAFPAAVKFKHGWRVWEYFRQDIQVVRSAMGPVLALVKGPKLPWGVV